MRIVNISHLLAIKSFILCAVVSKKDRGPFKFQFVLWIENVLDNNELYQLGLSFFTLYFVLV
jgi:hypothetical protein